MLSHEFGLGDEIQMWHLGMEKKKQTGSQRVKGGSVRGKGGQVAACARR